MKMLQPTIVTLVLLGVTSNVFASEEKEKTIDVGTVSPADSQCVEIPRLGPKNFWPLLWTVTVNVEKLNESSNVSAILVHPFVALTTLPFVDSVKPEETVITIDGKFERPRSVIDNHMIVLSKPVKLGANVEFPIIHTTGSTFENCTCLHTRVDPLRREGKTSRVKIISASACNYPELPEELWDMICVQYMNKLSWPNMNDTITPSQMDQLLCPLGGSRYALLSVNLRKLITIEDTHQRLGGFHFGELGTTEMPIENAVF